MLIWIRFQLHNTLVIYVARQKNYIWANWYKICVFARNWISFLVIQVAMKCVTGQLMWMNRRPSVCASRYEDLGFETAYSRCSFCLRNLTILSHGFHTRCHALSIPLRTKEVVMQFLLNHKYRNVGKYCSWFFYLLFAQPSCIAFTFPGL